MSHFWHGQVPDLAGSKPWSLDTGNSYPRIVPLSGTDILTARYEQGDEQETGRFELQISFPLLSVSKVPAGLFQAAHWTLSLDEAGGASYQPLLSNNGEKLQLISETEQSLPDHTGKSRGKKHVPERTSFSFQRSNGTPSYAVSFTRVLMPSDIDGKYRASMEFASASYGDKSSSVLVIATAASFQIHFDFDPAPETFIQAFPARTFYADRDKCFLFSQKRKKDPTRVLALSNEPSWEGAFYCGELSAEAPGFLSSKAGMEPEAELALRRRMGAFLCSYARSWPDLVGSPHKMGVDKFLRASGNSRKALRLQKAFPF